MKTLIKKIIPTTILTLTIGTISFAGDTVPFFYNVLPEFDSNSIIDSKNDVISFDLWEDEEKNYSYLTKVETNNNTITAICLKNRPENNFSIKLKISGDLTSENTVSKDNFNSTIGDINNILKSVTGAVE